MHPICRELPWKAQVLQTIYTNEKKTKLLKAKLFSPKVWNLVDKTESHTLKPCQHLQNPKAASLTEEYVCLQAPPCAWVNPDRLLLSSLILTTPGGGGWKLSPNILIWEDSTDNRPSYLNCTDLIEEVRNFMCQCLYVKLKEKRYDFFFIFMIKYF